MTCSCTASESPTRWAFPKGDAHDWENATVEFFGKKFRTYGSVTHGIEDLIPLLWNKKVKVERYG